MNAQLVRVLTASALACALAVPVAAQSVTAADAGPLLGAWKGSFDGPEGPFTMGLTLKDDAGALAAEVSGELFTAGKISIARTAAGLALTFTIDVQGMPVPTMLSVTPDGDKVKMQWDLADGQFSLTGSGTKAQ